MIANIEKDKGLMKAKEICDFLTSRGKSAGYIGIERAYDEPEKFTEAMEKVPGNTQCVLVLGGDGTFIQVATPISKMNIPMLGINLGNMGFLAEVEKDNIENALEKLISGDYSIEGRMMLGGATVKDEKMLDKRTALNDIVLTRGRDICIISYEIYVNGKFLGEFDADGIVVSTPTGSTGYSMSAGGPIVEPDSELILITPVSAHTLNSRSIVLSPDDSIRIIMKSRREEHRQSGLISFDGARPQEIKSGDYVDIERADIITKVIKINKESFLEILSRKISS